MADKREEILSVARATAQAHGYNGLSFRELAKAVGVKSATVHYYFPTKGDLGAALARRYREDAEAKLAEFREKSASPVECLQRYVDVFRAALSNDSRMCMCAAMAAETDDLPEPVKAEVKAFTDLNVDWLAKILAEANPGADAKDINRKALAIFAAIGGAQLAARSQGDISVYDAIIDGYRAAGLIPS
jgi:TetR/AcrR family transcriptional repressor of nem operon